MAELSRRLVAELAGGSWRAADTLNFWALDAGRWCECGRCTALGTPTDRLLLLVNYVRAAIRNAFEAGRLQRNVRIWFPIYSETLAPPTRPLPADFDYENCLGIYFPITRCYVHYLDDPGCTEYNAYRWKCFLDWQADRGHYKGQLFAGEYFNISRWRSLPAIYPRIMSHDIPLYYQHGVRHLHYMHVYTGLLGPKRLNNYLLAKLLWNAQADVAPLLDEYFPAFYATAGPRMKQLYERLEYGMSPITQWKQGPNGFRHRVANDLDPLFPEDHLRLSAHRPAMNDGVDLEESVAALADCRRIMGDLLAKPWPKPLMERLREDDRNVWYGYNTVSLYFGFAQAILAKRAGDMEGARRFYRATLPFAEALRAETGILRTADGPENYKNGLEASGIQAAWQKFGQSLGM